MTFSAEGKVQLKVDDVVWREVGDELVVLELSTSTYLTLNGSAKHLWIRLAEGATPGELTTTLTDRYPITVEQASSDVRAFLTSLSERELLAVDD
jgi:hypothetical protein